MSGKKEDEASTDKWRGEAGIGSGDTGGDHAVHSVFIIAGLGFAVGAALITTLTQNPLSVVAWLSPVVVFGTTAHLLRRRCPAAMLVLWVLTLLAGVFALVAMFPPDSKM